MEEIPFEDRFIPKAEIQWERSLWWWYPVTRAIHPAMRITALMTSAVGLIVMVLGLNLADWLFSPSWMDNVGAGWTWRSMGSLRVAQVEVGQSRLFHQIGLKEFAYLTFCLMWLTAVSGLFGGILTRRAAVELGQRTVAPWGETIKLILRRWVSVLWVTGMHLVALLLLLAVPFLLGLIARASALTPVACVILLLLFPLTWAVGRAAISMVACFPLALTAITVEKNADAFEGVSRSNACFFQRPVVTALLIIALAGVGWVGYQLMYWLFLVGWHWMRDAFLSGAGLSLSTYTNAPTQEVGEHARLISEWLWWGGALSRLFLASFWFSYFWSASAAVYLVLRKAVYNAELDMIDTPTQAAAAELPNLPASPASTPAASASTSPAAPGEA